MPRADSFWALMKEGVAQGRRAWRPVNISMLRSAMVSVEGARCRLTQEIGFFHNFGQSVKFRMTFRLGKVRAGSRVVRTFINSVKAVFKGPNAAGFHEGIAYIHLPLSSFGRANIGWKDVRLALNDRSHRRKRLINTKYEGSVSRAQRFIRRIMRVGPKAWEPDYASFRKIRTFRACGFRWLVLCEGLWNEWDSELNIFIETGDNIWPDDWDKIKASGLIEALARDVGRLGYRISMRARLHGTHGFLQFAKPIRPKRIKGDVRRLLGWRIPIRLKLQPPKHHSTKLFLES